MKFFDINKQYLNIKDAVDQSIAKVLERGDFIQGQEVKELEGKLSSEVGNHCLTVGNGTDALVIALMSLNLNKQDEVIAPAFTWVSTIESIKLAGAKPVFCDIDYETFNLSLQDVKDKITSNTKVILAVSLFGQCAELLELKRIAKENGMTLIEDAAQSFGATHHESLSCSIADISTTSFFPTKPLGCFGDGGAIFTNNEDLLEKVNVISKNGQAGRYNYVDIGVNSRLDTMQAAILLEKLKINKQESSRKEKIASMYNLGIENPLVVSPKVEKYNTSVYALHTLKIKDNRRDFFKEQLDQKSIPCGLYYPLPIHHAEPYKNEVYLPITQKVCSEILSIPMHAYLSDEEVGTIVDVINQIPN